MHFLQRQPVLKLRKKITGCNVEMIDVFYLKKHPIFQEEAALCYIVITLLQVALRFTNKIPNENMLAIL